MYPNPILQFSRDLLGIIRKLQDTIIIILLLMHNTRCCRLI